MNKPADGPRYRPDIDGLRVIAVVPVVLYHFGVRPFSGGYVGVDVFFVISGYLITSLIHGEMQDGRFSIVDFYERRVRRIFPALFAMLAVTAIAALVALFPNALIAFGKSLLATAGFVSNFQFWSEAGYFDAAASEKPLLHTWSLAVEEQFYLLFPGLLLLLRGASRKRLLAVLGIILLASLALNIWGIRHWPVSTFYLLPSRFWELMLGSILAIGAFETPHGVRNVLSALGLVLIGIAVFTFTAATPFPGENALLPCLGAALVIQGGAGGLGAVNRLLANRVLVLIGLMSYSLYLWHWPVLVIAKAYSPDGLGAVETVALIALSAALAALSWRYIERPFRGRSGILSRNRLFAAAGISIALLAAAGAVMWTTKGLPQRYDARVQTILAEANDTEPRIKRCLGISAADVANGKLCKVGNEDAPPSFILWGDSHAESMMPALDGAARDKGRAGVFTGNGNCPPLMGIDQPEAPRCKAFNDAVAKLATSKGIAEVFLHCRWAEYAGTSPFIAEDRPIVLNDNRAPNDNLSVLARGLTRTVQMLTDAHKKVVIIASVPEFREAVPEALARIALSGSHRDIRPTRAAYLARQQAVFDLFAQLQSKFAVTIVYPHEVLCASGICEAERDGRPLYRDFHHLSVWGADQLVPLVEPTL
jgi:peptidoglycan/LPS O-acetylase OafA/YrhL